jgi:nitroreductase
MESMSSESSSEEPGFPFDDHVTAVGGVMEAIYRRRAVRSYRDEPVARDDIEALVDAAIQAPSAVNCQPWGFVVVQTRETLDRLADAGTHLLLGEPPDAEVLESGLPEMDRLRQMAASPDFKLFHEAPALIVIYATADSGATDCFLAAQNLMLAAWSRGLGTCPIGLAQPLFNRAEVKAELEVSPEWRCALPIVVGRPVGTTPSTSRRPAQIAAWR